MYDILLWTIDMSQAVFVIFAYLSIRRSAKALGYHCRGLGTQSKSVSTHHPSITKDIQNSSAPSRVYGIMQPAGFVATIYAAFEDDYTL